MYFGMIRDGNSDGCIRQSLLHHDMTTALTYLNETMFLEDIANLLAREDAKFTQSQPPIWSRTLLRANEP